MQARGFRKANYPTKGRLTYHKDNFLSLELQYRKEGEWQPCFNIPNVSLPSVAYLGFSAHTGEVSGTSFSVLLTIDNHDLINVETKTIYSSTGGRAAPADKPEPKKGRSRSPSGGKVKPAKKGDSFGMALLRVVGVLVIMGLAYFIWTAYRAQQENRF
jgi:mannose-binding lectin 2